MRMRRRVMLVTLLLLGGLIADQAASVAQTPGSELAEEVTGDVTGDDAYVALVSVDGFDPAGGEAVFEPGTAYEEAFSYTAAEFDTNHLIGLTRPSPMPHSPGVFVQSSVEPAQPEGSPGPTPAPTAAPTPAGSSNADDAETAPAAQAMSTAPLADADGGESSEGASGADSQEASTCFTTDPLVDCVNQVVDGACEPAEPGQSCTDTVIQLIVELIGDPLNDLCDPNDTGQSCNEWLGHFVGDPVDDICDPNDTGQSCNEWLAQFIDNDCTADPVSCVLLDPCPEQTPEECLGIPELNLDPEDLIVDGLYNSLLDEPGDCDVSVEGPSKFQDGSTGIWFVTGAGEAECPEYDEVEVTTCLQIKTPDGWKRKNCSEGPLAGNYDNARVIAPCYKTHKYRTKFMWEAVVHAKALDGVELEDAPSSGIKKTPIDGVKITCPDP